jgi:uncharacterized membrane protein YcjF (UPF0283 family)
LEQLQLDENGPSAWIRLLLVREIMLTLFICGQYEISPELIIEMLNRDLMASDYHRKLSLVAVEKLSVACPGASEILGALWQQLLSPGTVSRVLAVELVRVHQEHNCSFDRWDAPLPLAEGFVSAE